MISTVAVELWIQKPEEQLRNYPSAISMTQWAWGCWGQDLLSSYSEGWDLGNTILETWQDIEMSQRGSIKQQLHINVKATNVTPLFRDRGRTPTVSHSPWFGTTSHASVLLSSINTSTLVFSISNLILHMYQTDQMSCTYVRYNVSWQ